MPRSESAPARIADHADPGQTVVNGVRGHRSHLADPERFLGRVEAFAGGA